MGLGPKHVAMNAFNDTHLIENVGDPARNDSNGLRNLPKASNFASDVAQKFEIELVVPDELPVRFLIVIANSNNQDVLTFEGGKVISKGTDFSGADLTVVLGIEENNCPSRA